MKQTYQSPRTTVVVLQTQHLLTQSETFDMNGEKQIENSDAILSRQGNIWLDDEED